MTPTQNQAPSKRDSEIAKKFPFVQHYTDDTGLKGILSSQTLWATDAFNLNDKAEISYSEKVFEELLEHLIKKEEKAYRMANIFTTVVKGMKIYILSFCGINNQEDAYQNGYLTMWRGYGNFALVFKTKDLIHNIAEFEKNFDLGAFLFDKAIYKNHVGYIRKEFPNDLKDFRKYCYEIEHRGCNSHKRAIELLIRISWFSKHPGFIDEREVRLIFSPSQENEKIMNRMQKNREELKIPLQNPPSHTNKRVLFGQKDQKLPIQEIIIGPGKNQEENEQKAKDLVQELGLNIPVRKSTIPFLSHHSSKD
tara:strand:- start:676 stop:1599 length:924 start_codon:yes stop_codon:yes gene_type:complete